MAMDVISSLRVNPCPAEHDYCGFSMFHSSTKSQLLGMKCVSKRQDLPIVVLKLNKCQ